MTPARWAEGGRKALPYEAVGSMRGSMYFLAAVAFMAAVPELRGEPPSAPRQDETTLSSKTRIAPAVPDPKVAERDTDEAAAVIEQRERDDDLIRKEVREPERRPDLDHDVVQGIQSLNVENALRRR